MRSDKGQEQGRRRLSFRVCFSWVVVWLVLLSGGGFRGERSVPVVVVAVNEEEDDYVRQTFGDEYAGTTTTTTSLPWAENKQVVNTGGLGNDVNEDDDGLSIRYDETTGFPVAWYDVDYVIPSSPDSDANGNPTEMALAFLSRDDTRKILQLDFDIHDAFSGGGGGGSFATTSSLRHFTTRRTEATTSSFLTTGDDAGSGSGPTTTLTTVRFHQTYGDVYVYEADVAVTLETTTITTGSLESQFGTTNTTRVAFVMSSYKSGVTLGNGVVHNKKLTPKYSKDDILDAASYKMGQGFSYKEPHLTVWYQPSTYENNRNRKVLGAQSNNNNNNNNAKGNSKLVYRVQARPDDKAKDLEVLIDANKGDVLEIHDKTFDKNKRGNGNEYGEALMRKVQARSDKLNRRTKTRLGSGNAGHGDDVGDSDGVSVPHTKDSYFHHSPRRHPPPPPRRQKQQRRRRWLQTEPFNIIIFLGNSVVGSFLFVRNSVKMVISDTLYYINDFVDDTLRFVGLDGIANLSNRIREFFFPQPTEVPSGVPTLSIRPSGFPTSAPTGQPTLSHSPTLFPSGTPTDPPTISSRPSASPTDRPTANPTEEAGRANVFDPDPISSSGKQYGDVGFTDRNDANSPQLNTQLVRVLLRDLSQLAGRYYLRGPYAYIVDVEAPRDGLWAQKSLSFLYDRSRPQFEAINCYYHIDNVMRYLTEELQLDIKPLKYRGGVRFDPHGVDGDDNSHYFASENYLAFGTGGVDDAEDPDVVVHELGHGLHDWISSGGISNNEGLSEGFGDYIASSYRRSRERHDLNTNSRTYHWVMKWDGHNTFWNGRISNYKASYPNGLTGQIHTDGQIFSSCNLQVWDALGRKKTDRIVLVGLSMTTSNANQLDAANAIMRAARRMLDDSDVDTVKRIYRDCGYRVNKAAEPTSKGLLATDASTSAARASETEICGNGVREGSEECDGHDLGHATCADKNCMGSVNLDDGTTTPLLPRCNSNCRLDYRSCVASGNNTPHPQLSSSSLSMQQSLYRVDVTPDKYGSEVTWEILAPDTNDNANGHADANNRVVLAKGGPYADNFPVRSSDVVCLDTRRYCYTFTIRDSYGDGLCCSFGKGSYGIRMIATPDVDSDTDTARTIGYGDEKVMFDPHFQSSASHSLGACT